MTKSEALLTAPALLSNARFILEAFTKRGGSVKDSFLGAGKSAWRMDVMDSLMKAARAPKKTFGSFDVTHPFIWSATLGFTVEAVSAVLLINAGELTP